MTNAMILAVVSISALPAFSQTVTTAEKHDPKAAKASNINAAKQLNDASLAGQVRSGGDPKADAKATADAVNKVPGAKVTADDLVAPDAKPIKGFHPIKKALQPVKNLEAMSVKLEQQIMKLEAPIAGLQPPMVSLQSRMTNVDGSMSKMQEQLNTVQSQMTGVRDDLARMRQEIAELKAPIVSIQKPLEGVSEPLEAVETQLNEVLAAILMAAIAIAIGTPMAALLVYRYRSKLFPAKTLAALPGEREKVLH